MQTIRDIADLRGAIRQWRRAGESVALVPTMGALHEGHLALVRAARAQADHVVASIFVNPTQFGPTEDFDAYPRREAEDAAMLADVGTSLLWAPDAATMYPPGHATRISIAGLDSVLCGAARPGHFDGVGTIVAKLFNQVRPDIAVFGEKDWQQLAIIRRMTRDLDLEIDIIGLPTVREADGLAMSSRNAYLTLDQRRSAAMLPQAMQQAVVAIASGTGVARVIAKAKTAIRKAGFDSIDYCELRDGESLQLIDQPGAAARLFVAARIGKTRLIDNWPV